MNVRLQEQEEETKMHLPFNTFGNNQQVKISICLVAEETEDADHKEHKEHKEDNRETIDAVRVFQEKNPENPEKPTKPKKPANPESLTNNLIFSP